MPGPNEKDQRNEENTGRDFERLVDEMYGREEEEEEEGKKEKDTE